MDENNAPLFLPNGYIYSEKVTSQPIPMNNPIQ
jgi:hypothetical protein